MKSSINQINQNSVFKVEPRSGEMTQSSTEHTTLAKDQSSAPSTHTVWLPTAYNSGYMDIWSLWLSKQPVISCMYSHIKYTLKQN